MRSSLPLSISLIVLPLVHGFSLKKPDLIVTKGHPLIPDLESLIEKSNKGVDSSTLEDMKSIMTQIKGEGDQRLKLPGQWELVYTTEKEILFFLTSWPFARVTSITQDLDVYEKGTVRNSINFEGDAAFQVDGKVEPVDNEGEFDRVAFEFSSATAKVWKKSIALPPVGAGWFDTVYADELLRISHDLRDDWSVYKRL